MAITYFGQQVTSGGNIQSTGAIWSRNVATTFTSPAGGPWYIVELSVYCARTAGAPLMNIAIYDNANNRIAQGASAYTVGSALGWQGYLNPSLITPNPVIIQGSTLYKLGFTFDITGTTIYSSTAIAQQAGFQYITTNYTAGWPASLADGGTNDFGIWAIRCGVVQMSAVSSWILI